MNDAIIIAIATGINIVVLGLFKALNSWVENKQKYNAERHKTEQEDRTRQFTEQGLIIDRQEKQIARLEAQIQAQQKTINEIHEMHTDCREETARLRVFVMTLIDTMQQQTGHTVKIPDWLNEANRKAKDEADFLAKQASHDTNLVKGLNDKIKAAPPAT